MSTVARGARNALRNTIRTGGVTIILALSIGLALVMLIALKAVQSRIAQVKSSIGNTIVIQPAGFSGFSSVNNALTTSQLAPISSLPHVTKVVETLNDRLTTIGTTGPQFGPFGQSNSNSTNQTNLTSPVKLNSNGRGGGRRIFINGGPAQLPANFSLPISVEGTTDPATVSGNVVSLSSGQLLDGSKDTSDAMVSTDMATKNNLKIGSTFKAYGTTLTVTGIFAPASDNRAASNTIVLALPTLQRLTNQAGDVTAATAYVDSVTNMNSVQAAITSKLGSGADVTNAQTQAQNAIAPLQNIETVATYSLIGALIAGSVIIFLTMLMIVRERRREIGVLKAIGASNVTIVVQFISEALTLTLAGAVVGLVGGLALANPVIQLMAASSNSGPRGGGFAGRGGSHGFFHTIGGGIQGGFNTLHSVVGFDILLYGLAVALVIAIVGSALPAFAISKVRPAEVMRGE